MILPIFPKNRMKLRKFWTVGRRARRGGGAATVIRIAVSSYYIQSKKCEKVTVKSAGNLFECDLLNNGLQIRFH